MGKRGSKQTMGRAGVQLVLRGNLEPRTSASQGYFSTSLFVFLCMWVSFSGKSSPRRRIAAPRSFCLLPSPTPEMN